MGWQSECETGLIQYFRDQNPNAELYCGFRIVIFVTKVRLNIFFKSKGEKMGL